MKVTLCIYALQWHVKWNPYLNKGTLIFPISSIPSVKSLSEYFIHIHMYWGSQSLFPFMYWVHREELYVSRARNYDMYLGLGMRYESEIWTIVISINRAFKWCQFCCGLNFDPNSCKTMDYSLCLSAIFGKNVTAINNHFYDIIWKLFWCGSQWYNPQLHTSITQWDTICLPLDNDRVFAVMWTSRMELSNDVHFSIAVHQNASSDLPDIHVKQPQRQTLTLSILISNLLVY